MIKAIDFCNLLKENGIDFFCGVPDSLLKDFCAYVTDTAENGKHVITANEGNAVALAAGHYLSCGSPAVVYMQNSGIGNCVNPLLSLIDEEVYRIPLLMLIGWRGEPGVKDEPQHIKQGKVTDKLLEAMNIKYAVLPQSFDEAKTILADAINYTKIENKPFALIVKKDTFEQYELKNKIINSYEISRENAIKAIVKHLDNNDIVVSSTGHISRELYEARESHEKDFLTIGSMGHSSSIALGIALEKKDKNVFCFDGDGAAIMHLGAMPVIGSLGKKLGITNFKHIIFNNEAHCSVGAQPTCADNIDFPYLAYACGYDVTFSVSQEIELEEIIVDFLNVNGTALLEIKVNTEVRKDLRRPKELPVENKENFMEFLDGNICYCGSNAKNELGKILKKENAKNILVFTSKKSYEFVKKDIHNQLEGCNFIEYSDFATNPKTEDLQKALDIIDFDYDFIAAVGGGSVIDFAKAFRFCVDRKINALQIKDTKQQAYKRTKLAAVPLTAGTGAEVTKFAVIYIDGKKYSIDDKSVLPDYALVESTFVQYAPAYVKACCAMDAFCQAIESYWAVGSTSLSRQYAKESIILCKNNIINYVNSNDLLSAQKMALASNLAGKAINISRTTAAHALSYKITTMYGIPHGHAVSLSIGGLMEANFNANVNSTIDYRGFDFVRDRMSELKQLLEIENPRLYFQNLLAALNLKYKLSDLNIQNVEQLVDAVDLDRLKNNPVKLTREVLLNIFNP